jgi:endonuclease/exonuclease/phosphatase family metal-dependent hydrolase
MKRQRLRIVTYNIHKGMAPAGRGFALGRMRELLRATHADLVFLQEVLGSHARHGLRIAHSGTTAQHQYVADGTWGSAVYGKNAEYAKGHHGNAVLSSLRVLSQENIDVSTNRLERRGLLHVVLDLPDRIHPLHVVCVHLNLLESGRRDQLAQLCDKILLRVPRPSPLIVAGDFNDWRERATGVLESRLQLKDLYQEVHGEHARTFPSWKPVLRLDRVYGRGVRVEHARVLTQRPWHGLSDHAPLCVEVLV